MMDLACEYHCNFTQSTMSGDWNQFCESILIKNDFELIPYKNNTGDGYNYIYPIFNVICYSDSYVKNSEPIVIEVIKSGVFNYFNTGFNYDGSSVSQEVLTGSTGEITGTGYFITSGASFLNSSSSYYVSLPFDDLTGTENSRTICLSKVYNFTGVQPIYINSNYTLADISKPIVCSNFIHYSYDIDENCSCGLFYYLYDINNPKNDPIKISAPDLTYISDMCWRDEEISAICNTSDTAQIVNNLARINLNIKNFIYENKYFLDTGLFNTLCINVIGGL